MSVSSRARSPLSIADRIFTLTQAGPAPLGVHPAELADPDLPGLRIPGLGTRWDGPISLACLQRYLCRPSTPAAVKQRAWSLLASRAQGEGGSWTLGAVGVALPKLVRLATELAGANTDIRPDLDTEVLTGFLHGLASVNPPSPQVWPTLLREARRAGLAWLRHQRATDALISGDATTSAPPRAPWGHPDLVLAQAARAGVITTDEAALIGATRLEGVSTDTIAAHLELSAWAVLKRRRRAERRLVAYLTDNPDTTNPASRAAAAHRSDCPRPGTDRAFYQHRTPVPTPRTAAGAVRASGRRTATPGRSVR